MLTPKQQRFVAEYLVDSNATQAAIRAGYSKRTANEQGSRLLAKASVKAAVAAGQKRQFDKLEITAESVKARIGQIAFQDIRKLYDANGNLRPIHQLDDDAAAFVGGLEVIKKNAAAGDGLIDTVHKVKVVDPIKALEMLGKHVGLFEDVVRHTGELKLTWQS